MLSLNTAYREYAALITLPYCELLPDVLDPHPLVSQDKTPEQIKKACSAFQVNIPQANAILKTIQTKGFSLIQGCVPSISSFRFNPNFIAGLREQERPRRFSVLLEPTFLPLIPQKRMQE